MLTVYNITSSAKANVNSRITAGIVPTNSREVTPGVLAAQYSRDALANFNIVLHSLWSHGTLGGYRSALADLISWCDLTKIPESSHLPISKINLHVYSLPGMLCRLFPGTEMTNSLLMSEKLLPPKLQPPKPMLPTPP
jgi:hypothetical protein